MPESPIHIRSLHREEIGKWLGDRGQQAYRAGQILHWLYRQRVESWDSMSNLSRDLRDRLSAGFAIDLPQVVTERNSPGDARGEGTRKFLWRLADGAMIESVLVPASPDRDGEVSGRRTLCVSTQVGCAYGCAFCASGLDGFKRNLEPHEIVDQVLATQLRLGDDAGTGRSIDNLVFMGMGEPLANYPNLIRALGILNAPWGIGIGARRITISTSGLAPRIRELAGEARPFRLAVSLHGPTDEVRERIMPINRRYPLGDLMAACEQFTRMRGSRITLEYILIEGINSDLDLVEPLARMALRLRARVNLIPCNRVEGLSWRRPGPDRQNAFRQALEARDVNATLRREKGHDIDAACGQLRLVAEKKQSRNHVTARQARVVSG